MYLSFLFRFVFHGAAQPAHLPGSLSCLSFSAPPYASFRNASVSWSSRFSSLPINISSDLTASLNNVSSHPKTMFSVLSHQSKSGSQHFTRAGNWDPYPNENLAPLSSILRNWGLTVNLHPLLLISVIQTSHSRSRPARGFCLRTNNEQDKKGQFLFTSSTYYSLQEPLKPCPSLVVLQTCPPSLLPQNMHIRRSHPFRQDKDKLSCALDSETNGSTCTPWYRKKKRQLIKQGLGAASSHTRSLVPWELHL